MADLESLQSPAGGSTAGLLSPRSPFFLRQLRSSRSGVRERLSALPSACCPLAAIRHQVSGLPQHLEDPQ